MEPNSNGHLWGRGGGSVGRGCATPCRYMKPASIRSRIVMVVLMAGVLPLLLSEVADAFLGHIVLTHEALHNAVEFGGAFVAVLVAVLLLLRTRYESSSAHLVWIVAGLVTMGIMDFAHALSQEGPAWSWLRHGSTFAGGVFFGCVWVPLFPAALRHRRWFIASLAAFIGALSAAIWRWPGLLPVPWIGGAYTLPVELANFLGGLGFLSAAANFLWRYARRPQPIDLAFASHALLFSAAGLLFGFSQRWTADWWCWHAFRLLAYTVLLLATYRGVAELYQTIARHAVELKNEVKDRTAELRIIAAFPLENPSPVLRASPDGSLLFANRASAELLSGWRCALGQRLPESVRSHISSALESGIPQDLEVTVGSRVLLFSIVGVPDSGYVNFYGRDITERKQAEQHLQERENELRLLTNTVPALISYIDKDLRYRFVNRQYEVWFGAKRESLLGKTMSDVLGEEAVGCLAPFIQRALQGEEVWFEIQVPYVHSGSRWIHAHYVPDRKTDGSIPGFFVLVLDITERKQAQEKLRQHTERQAMLLQITGALVSSGHDLAFLARLVCDKAGKHLDADLCLNYRLNPAANSLELVAGFGLPPDQSEEFRELKIPTDAVDPANSSPPTEAQVMAFKERFLSQRMRVRAFSSQALHARDGRLLGTFCVGSTTRERFTHEEVDFLHTLGHFISLAWERLDAETALKAAEERNRLALTAAQLGTWEYTEAGSMLQFDLRARALFGIRQEQLRFADLLPLIHPDDRSAIEALYARARDSRVKAPFIAEHRLCHPGLPDRWLYIHGSVEFEGDGLDEHPVRSLGTVQDITERKVAEAALHSVQEQLQRHAEILERTVQERTAKLQDLVGELEHFSYSITHDMRSPLRAISGFAELAIELSSQSDQPDLKTFLHRIRSAAQRMDLLITDSLNYSKVVRQALHLAPVDLGALLRGMLDSYPEFLPAKATIHLQDSIPSVLGNEAALTQCFSNLLGNAVKFVKPGQVPEIRVWAERRDEHVRVYVQDKGIGIHPMMLPRVFDMFSRGHNAGEYLGTGIGLALVRKVVQRMDGSVGVQSEIGKGTRFWVELKAVDSGQG